MATAPRRAALAACVVAALFAGCGGADENNAYVDRVNRAQQGFAATVADLSGRITATSSAAADRRTLRRFGTSVAAVVRDLRAVTPPADVRPQHGDLVRAIDGYGAEVRRATAGVRRADPREVRGAQRRLDAATTRVRAAINAAIGAINRRLGTG